MRHRPIAIEHAVRPRSSAQPSGSKPASAHSSAMRLNKIELHSASRLCLSRGLSVWFPHLIGAPIDSRGSLPLGRIPESPDLVSNHTVHEEQPQNDGENGVEPPAVDSRPAVVGQTSASVGDGSAGESTTTKRKSKPFRRVVRK